MNYLNWMKKKFPELSSTPKEAVESYILEAKSDTKLLREFIKVLGAIFFFIPFTLYLSISEVPTFLNPFYWLLLIGFYGVGGFVYLYCEQRLIKKCLRKIVQLKYT